MILKSNRQYAKRYTAPKELVNSPAHRFSGSGVALHHLNGDGLDAIVVRVSLGSDDSERAYTLEMSYTEAAELQLVLDRQIELGKAMVENHKLELEKRARAYRP